MFIPDKTDRFNMFIDVVDLKHKIAVTSEITLPTFEYASETLNLSGMAGEVDSPSPGQAKSTQIEIPFSTISKEGLELARKDNSTLIFKAAQETINTNTLTRAHTGRTIIIKGFTKEVNYGKLVKGGLGNASIKKEIIYYKDQIGDDVLTEIDKFNGIHKINGEDVISDIENLIS